MSDDDVLKALGRVRRERIAPDSPDALADAELSRPLDATARARIVDRMAAELRPPMRAERPNGGRRRRLFLLGGALAAAAVALFVLYPRQLIEPPPAYTLTVVSSAQALRSAPTSAGLAVFAPGSRIEFRLQPAVATAELPKLCAYIRRDGALEAWSPPVETAPGGSMRIVGLREQVLPAGRGRWTLVFVLAKVGAEPSREEVERALAEGVPEGVSWRILATDMVVTSGD